MSNRQDMDQDPIRRSVRIANQGAHQLPPMAAPRQRVPVSQRHEYIPINEEHDDNEARGIYEQSPPHSLFSSSNSTTDGRRNRAMSIISIRSTDSTTARRLAEAELKSAEAAANLEDEEERLGFETRRIQREKMLNKQRLALERAKIQEDADLHDINGSDSDSSERRQNELKNLRDVTDPEKKLEKDVASWLNDSNHKTQLSSSEDKRQGASDMTILTQTLTKTLQIVQQQATTAAGQPASRYPSRSNNFESARRTIGKDLTHFNGNPEHWPSFISEYNECTELCGFSDRENLQRLRRSLKGNALESVQGLLTSPDNVQEIISTLELTYGKPEHIVKVLIEKAKKVAPPKEDKFETIIGFANAVKNLATTMETLKCVNHLSNPQLLEDLYGKLPASWKTEWCLHVARTKLTMASVKDFAVWIRDRAEALSLMSVPKFDEKPPGKFEKKFEKSFERNENRSKKTVMTTVGEGDPKTFLYCDKKGHILMDCHNFKKLEVDGRWKWLTEKKNVCFNCLKPGHLSSKCEKEKCGEAGCGRTHHRLLHQIRTREPKKDGGKSKERPKTPTKEDETETKEVMLSQSFLQNSASTILLKVVEVILKSSFMTVRTFALLDECSSVTMIDADMAKKLRIAGPKKPLALQGTGKMTEIEEDSQIVKIGISGVNDEREFPLENVRTRNNLCPALETFEYKKLPWKLKNLKEIDLQALSNAKPTILIGADNFDLIKTTEWKKGLKNTMGVGKTKLGWTICGRISAPQQSIKNSLAFVHFEKSGDERDIEIHEMVKEHFKIEDLGVKIVEENLSSKEDKKAIQIMDQTTRRVDSGWETGLIWKSDNIIMPPSKTNAFRRLQHMERKMDKDQNFSELYHERIKYYLDNKYARYLTSEEINDIGPKTWYLPHFGVVNPNKPGKIRFVFDAAATAGGTSLNDKLLTGPDLLTSLPGCLIKFRQREIGFSGDIKDFFHRIKIRKEDQCAQRFLWRGNDRHREPDTLVMQVSIFGAVCAPYTSQAAKNRNAKEFETEYPEASKAIIQRHYMDDYLDSAHTSDEVIKLIREVIGIHKSGDMEIGKWSCSSREVLLQIPPELRADEDKELNLGEDMNTERVLGLSWNPNTDSLSFNLKFHKVNPDIVGGTKRPTKRDVLKLVMSIFDPLGLLGHFTIQGKILLQDIWRSELGWDDELTQELDNKWKNWISQLGDISSWKIPRCFSSNMADRESTQLHIFCDASEKAYAAVAYLRIGLSAHHHHTSIIMAKTRVAPLKPTTIPRLELQAAVIASRLATFIKKKMELKIDSCYYWSDSKTVLLWLKSETRRLKTFVAHRVGEILESTDVAEWNWISTTENVADEATRDSKPADLSSSSRWVSGPNFLQLPESEWPDKIEIQLKEIENEKDLEMKKEFAAATSVADTTLSSMTKFTWKLMIQKLAWIRRFISSCWSKSRTKKEVMPPELTVTELQDAEKFWLKKSQLDSFPDEMKLLTKSKPIPTTSSLFQLSPYLDEDGLLRLKGRITAAPGLDISTKFPIILHPKNIITRRLVHQYHVDVGHHGHERVINDLRQKYWILNIRTAVKHAWTTCWTCKNRRAKPQTPEMGQLPPIRLMSHVRPFTFTGVDYFGPMEVTIGRRHEKRYGALFTCMTTRAVHLEIAHSLSTDSAIMALQRMINRRGKPKRIYSDNGTNFTGADAEIRKSVEEMDHSKIMREMASVGIEWHFIPPAAPHMGGSWERLVKSVKVALKATLKDTAPKEEILQTLFTAAEMTVNSRPLTYVSGDPDSPESLTPNHFLLHGSSENAAFGEVDKNEKCLRRLWRYGQQLADHFWRRWTREYLPTLTKRTKWHQQSKPVEIGDSVIIMDNEKPRDSWAHGTIIATYPGKDGIIRVVDVKTKKNTYKRPVAKVIVVDVIPKIGNVTEVPIPGGRMSPSTIKEPEESQVLLYHYEI